jgi:hypothetical protein
MECEPGWVCWRSSGLGAFELLLLLFFMERSFELSIIIKKNRSFEVKVQNG